jgi:hypothetical protein
MPTVPQKEVDEVLALMEQHSKLIAETLGAEGERQAQIQGRISGGHPQDESDHAALQTLTSRMRGGRPRCAPGGGVRERCRRECPTEDVLTLKLHALGPSNLKMRTAHRCVQDHARYHVDALVECHFGVFFVQLFKLWVR